MTTMKKYLSTTLLMLAFAWHPVQAEEELLEPDKAFPFEVTVKDDTLQADWNIPKGYYLYRSKIRFSTDTPGISLGEPQLPAGKIKQDEFFGEIEIYQHPVTAQVPIVRENPEVTEFALKAVYQGCADIGVCYPPITKQVQLTLPAKSGGAVAALGALSESLGFGGGNEDEVLEPDQAFQFSMDVADPNTLMAYWQIAPDHYMYRGKISFDLADGQNMQLGQAQLPAGEKKHDEFFGDIEVYHDQVEARIPLIRTNLEPTTIQLTATYQGCAEKTGICYPPIKKTLSLALPATTTMAAVTEAVSPVPQPEVMSEQDQIAASLASGNTLLIILTFFGFGLLLAFTPCVFPMIPILSSIIVGQGESITTRKAFFMSLTYVLAMALTYTVAGVIAGT